jgi:hypothetical protein
MLCLMSNKKLFVVVLTSILWLCGCTQAQPTKPEAQNETKSEVIAKIKNEARVIHVLVALCDNENQGIVPVSASLGNGEDPQKNLYWGAAFGVKTFFGSSVNWTKVSETNNPKENVLQRIVFKHKRQNVYLVADAYRGIKMKETIDDFFAAVSGQKLENVKADDSTLQIAGSANLIAFVGHNGLMDFELTGEPEKKDEEKRDAIILACASRNYFAKHLKKTGANPLLWTSNLMAPEAYILHDALEGWINNETAQQIQIRAAAAYAKYQKIGQKSAQNLLVTGW